MFSSSRSWTLFLTDVFLLFSGWPELVVFSEQVQTSWYSVRWHGSGKNTPVYMHYGGRSQGQTAEISGILLVQGEWPDWWLDLLPCSTLTPTLPLNTRNGGHILSLSTKTGLHQKTQCNGVIWAKCSLLSDILQPYIGWQCTNPILNVSLITCNSWGSQNIFVYAHCAMFCTQSHTLYVLV